MLVWADYIEFKNPTYAEDILNDKEKYFKHSIPFRCKLEKTDIKQIEKVTGIKEVEYTKVLTIDYDTKTPIDFKRSDIIVLFGEQHIIEAIGEFIPEKFALKASRSKVLYDRYKKKVLFIK